MKKFDGGVCAAKGFKASGINCGIKKDKKDLSMIVADTLCNAAAVYTQNKVKGAPLDVTKAHLVDGKAQVVICNSGNANTCAPGGYELAENTCELVAKATGVKASDVIVASTGVIGQALNIANFETGVPEIASLVSYDGEDDAVAAIMTTDTVPKKVAVEFEIGGVKCTLGGMAKGSGMINPNMATMLIFLTTDAAISSEMLQKALSEDVKLSFNQICVDGDTSTNDMACIMANGMAGNEEITADGEAFATFCEALAEVTTHLSKKLAADGEGATKLIECNVTGAPDVETARVISKTVIASDLLKAAIYGSDANWGRVLCAIGYAPGDFSVENIDVSMSSVKGRVQVCEGSKHKEYSEEIATEILSEEEIIINVNMNQGEANGTAWGCDLTHEYVSINGDYRS